MTPKNNLRGDSSSRLRPKHTFTTHSIADQQRPGTIQYLPNTLVLNDVQLQQDSKQIHHRPTAHQLKMARGKGITAGLDANNILSGISRSRNAPNRYAPPSKVHKKPRNTAATRNSRPAPFKSAPKKNAPVKTSSSRKSEAPIANPSASSSAVAQGSKRKRPASKQTSNKRAQGHRITGPIRVGGNEAADEDEVDDEELPHAAPKARKVLKAKAPDRNAHGMKTRNKATNGGLNNETDVAAVADEEKDDGEIEAEDSGDQGASEGVTRGEHEPQEHAEVQDNAEVQDDGLVQ
jgi:hypothetical protein